MPDPFRYRDRDGVAHLLVSVAVRLACGPPVGEALQSFALGRGETAHARVCRLDYPHFYLSIAGPLVPVGRHGADLVVY